MRQRTIWWCFFECRYARRLLQFHTALCSRHHIFLKRCHGPSAPRARPACPRPAAACWSRCGPRRSPRCVRCSLRRAWNIDSLYPGAGVVGVGFQKQCLAQNPNVNPWPGGGAHRGAARLRWRGAAHHRRVAAPITPPTSRGPPAYPHPSLSRWV